MLGIPIFKNNHLINFPVSSEEPPEFIKLDTELDAVQSVWNIAQDWSRILNLYRELQIDDINVEQIQDNIEPLYLEYGDTLQMYKDKDWGVSVLFFLGHIKLRAKFPSTAVLSQGCGPFLRDLFLSKFCIFSTKKSARQIFNSLYLPYRGRKWKVSELA